MKKIENEKMQELEGGKPSAETAIYCGTLGMIMNNNGVSLAGLNAWEAHCESSYGTFHYY